MPDSSVSQRPPLAPPPHLAPVPPAYVVDGMPVHPALPYAALPGARPLELDLYRPLGDDAAPVIAFLHGGGWRVGSRRLVGTAATADLVRPFLEAGLAVAAVDYRLSGEATWPAQRDDVSTAIAWLRGRAGELGLDPTRVGVWGESAGAHLAATAGLLGTGSAAVSAVVGWYPPTDLAAIPPVLGTDPDATDSREALLIGGSLTARPDLARDASPVTHVRAGAPPYLLLHGEADTFVPCDQSRRLAAALGEVGAEVELHTYPGAEHMWLGGPEVAQDAVQRTLAFFSRHLADGAAQVDLRS
ncbi:alpha/beta hydrolase [Nocardioides insulae]|uniref:alpha/beta hydrolase n=1 Tax=Nocardioides insulae TaxID=394734 RepID=UPI00041AC54F|nr:alpha/beta hydrolase [Nocardioides insulae]